MLAEKFFLILETIISNRRPDGAPHVVSKCPFVPIDDRLLPCKRQQTGARDSNDPSILRHRSVPHR
jgi:hypothetical protein